MKRNAVLFAAWLNADPRRAKTISLVVLAGLVIAGAIVPGIVLAGEMTGGSG